MQWLERAANGDGNWPEFPKATQPEKPKTAMAWPRIGQFSLRVGRLNYQDRTTGVKAHTSLKMREGTNQAVHLQGQGKLANEPLQLSVQSGPLAVIEQGDPYNIRRFLRRPDLRSDIRA